MDARRGACKDTVEIRWQENEKYRKTQQAHGWTEEYCRYPDYLTTIDISYIAPWHQRHQYESTITLACNDEDRVAGPMKARKDFRPTTKILAQVFDKNKDDRIPLFMKNKRMRERLFDEALRAELEWMSQNWKTYFSQPSSSSSSTQKLVATRTSRLSMA